MKIAILGLRALGDTSGGVETHVRETAVRMAAKGHEITVFCRARYNPFSEDAFQGVRLVNRPTIYSKHLEAIVHTAICTPSVLWGYDVVHFHATGPSLLAWVPRLTGRKVVVTVHGLDYLRGKWGRGASLVLRAGAWTSARCPHATIVVSRELERHYAEKYGRDTAYIPNGVAEPVARPVDKLARFGVAGQDYVLYLGRLVPEKGAHYLIEAFREAAPGDMKLLLAGGSSHSDSYLEELKRAASGDPRIVFTGPLYGEEKDEALSNAGLFVFPSDLEGMPIVLLEAMSFGLPVLASDIPENLEVIRGADQEALGGPVALTFARGDAGDLAEKMRGMLGPGDLAGLGERARRYVLAAYDWDSITERTLEVYRELAGG